MTRKLTNPEAEKHVISACLYDNNAIAEALEMLGPEDFSEPKYRTVFEAEGKLFEAGKPVDLVTLTDHLQAVGKFVEVGGPSAISELGGFASSSINLTYWAKIIRDKAMLRRFVDKARGLVKAAESVEEDVPGWVDRAGAELAATGATLRNRGDSRRVSDLYADVLAGIDEVDERRGTASGRIQGVFTGFRRLDDLTMGMRPGEMAILAGRPQAGKTALALNIAANVAMDYGQTVAFFSLEMSAASLMERIISSRANIPHRRLRGREFDSTSWKSLVEVAPRFQGVRLLVDDSSTHTPGSIRTRCRRLQAQGPVDMVIVDYMSLISPPDPRQPREQQVAQMSRAMVQMAKDLRVVVLLLCQLRRGAEDRADKEPRLSDLRESGALEQDADLVMAVHRPWLYDRKVSPEKTTLMVLKQRNGPPGQMALKFDPRFVRFGPDVQEKEETDAKPAREYAQ